MEKICRNFLTNAEITDPTYAVRRSRTTIEKMRLKGTVCPRHPVLRVSAHCEANASAPFAHVDNLARIRVEALMPKRWLADRTESAVKAPIAGPGSISVFASIRRGYDSKIVDCFVRSIGTDS